jgi:hypothetical protein
MYVIHIWMDVIHVWMDVIHVWMYVDMYICMYVRYVECGKTLSTTQNKHFSYILRRMNLLSLVCCAAFMNVHVLFGFRSKKNCLNLEMLNPPSNTAFSNSNHFQELISQYSNTNTLMIIKDFLQL